MYARICEETSVICFRSVVVITSASHAEGPRFDPGREQLLLFISHVPTVSLTNS